MLEPIHATRRSALEVATSPRCVGRLSMHLLAAATGALAVGCALSDNARATFAAHHFCPSERVVVTERPDLKHPAHVAGYEMPPPPPDIQADPDRLALYMKEANRVQRPAREVDDGETYFEVKGCGDSELYRCSSLRSGNKGNHVCFVYHDPPIRLER